MRDFLAALLTGTILWRMIDPVGAGSTFRSIYDGLMAGWNAPQGGEEKEIGCWK